MIRSTYIFVILPLLTAWNAYGLDFYELQRGATYTLRSELPADVTCVARGSVRTFRLIFVPFSSSVRVPDDNRYYVNAVSIVEKDIIQTVAFAEYRLQVEAAGAQAFGPNCKVEVTQWPTWLGGHGRYFAELVTR